MLIKFKAATEIEQNLFERIQKLEQQLQQIDIFRVTKGKDYGLREYTQTKDKLEELKNKLKKLQSQHPKEYSEEEKILHFKRIENAENYIKALKVKKKDLIAQYGLAAYEETLRKKEKELKLLKNLNLGMKKANNLEIEFPNSSGTIGVRQKIKDFLANKKELQKYEIEYYPGFNYKQNFKVDKLKVIEYSADDEDDFQIGFIETGSKHKRLRQLDYYKLKFIKVC